MAAKTKTSREMADHYAEEIKRELDHWKYLYENGGSDPFWEDGVNLNLTRNHIIYYKRKCEETLTPEEYPAEYYVGTPPEVDNKYMARRTEIADHARIALAAYKKDSSYLFLQSVIGKLDKKSPERAHIASILRTVDGLEDAIRSGRYVDMRRHEKPEFYLDTFRQYRSEAEKQIGCQDQEKELPQGQLSIFDLYSLT